jgi:L-ascorbate metabolism protein UlaG (beta-lactamase superfamily)
VRIHHLRNATFVLEAAGERVLVDPMLGAKGTVAPPFAAIRHRPRRNPTVDLPAGAEALLEGVTAGLVTHCRRGHLDHLDRAGRARLTAGDLPVYCSARDEPYLRKRGLRAEPVRIHESRDFLGGSIAAFHAVHGYGLMAKLMGPGVGYLIELPGEPTVYVSGDTVLTDEVRRVLAERRPDVAVMAAGVASFDIGRPILMPVEELLEFARLAPGTVVANHLEAVNHCPMTRAELRSRLTEAELAERVMIPADGETLSEEALTPTSA